MMSEVKRCTQCGMLKNISEFRQYTYSKAKGTAGHFRICRSCEAVNTTYKRIFKKIETLHKLQPPGYLKECDELMQEAQKIDALYALLDAHGLRTPKRGTIKEEAKPFNAVDSAVEQLTTFYGELKPVVPAPTAQQVVEVPEELQAWLDADPAEWAEKDLSPEYLQETIYESLKAKYRPQTGVDKETYLPIYDDTYKQILNNILRKFDDYEEQYVEENNDSM